MLAEEQNFQNISLFCYENSCSYMTSDGVKDTYTFKSNIKLFTFFSHFLCTNKTKINFLANKSCEVICNSFDECFEIWDYTSIGCSNGYCICKEEDDAAVKLCKLPIGKKIFANFMKFINFC